MIVNIVSYSEELPRTLDLCYATYDNVTNYITFEDKDGEPYMVKSDDMLAILIPEDSLLDNDTLHILHDIFDVQQELNNEGRNVFELNVEE